MRKRDENLAKMMTQLELMTEHVMGAGPKGVNVVRMHGQMHYEGESSPPRYEEECQFMANQMGGFSIRVPRS